MEFIHPWNSNALFYYTGDYLKIIQRVESYRQRVHYTSDKPCMKGGPGIVGVSVKSTELNRPYEVKQRQNEIAKRVFLFIQAHRL